MSDSYSVLGIQTTVISTVVVTLLLVPVIVLGARFALVRKSSRQNQCQDDGSPVSDEPSLRDIAKELLHESLHPTELSLTGKESHNAIPLGLSMFSGWVGAWVITGPVEVGYNTGMWGVVLYSLACIIPILIFLVISPLIRRKTKVYGFSIIDFSAMRLGRTVEVGLVFLGLVLLFLANVADFTAFTGILYETSNSKLSQSTAAWDLTLLSTACYVYSTFGGFEASLYTDVVQGFAIVVLTIMLASVLIPLQSLASPESLAIAQGWNMTGLITGIVINVSVILVTYADNTFWQKFYAAKDNTKYLQASFICCAFYSPIVFVFGYIGTVAKALTLDGVIEEVLWPGNSIFALIKSQNEHWITNTVLLMATLCVMSSVDSRILASGNLVGQPLVSRNYNLNISRAFGLFTTIAAVATSIFQPASIMQILYIGNLFGCITSPAILMSAWNKTTKLSVWISAVATASTICTFGWVRMGTFDGGFQWWMFPEGYYELSCLYTFLAAIAVAFGTIIVVSLIENKYKSRKPAIIYKLPDPVCASPESSYSYSYSYSIAF